MICATRWLSMYIIYSMDCLCRTYCNCIRFLLANAFVQEKRTFSWTTFFFHFYEIQCIPWCSIIYNYMHIKCIYLSFLYFFFILFFLHCLRIATVKNKWYTYNIFIGNVLLMRMLTSVNIHIYFKLLLFQYQKQQQQQQWKQQQNRKYIYCYLEKKFEFNEIETEIQGIFFIVEMSSW